MLNLKYAFLQLNRKVTMTILIILQISVSFSLLYHSFYMKNKVNNEINKLDKIMKNQKKLLHMIPQGDLREYNVDDLKSFYEFLKNSRSFDHITLENGTVNSKYFESIEVLSPTTHTTRVEGVEYSFLNSMHIDFEGIKYLDLKVKEGRMLKEKDFTNDEISPVVLGSDYYGKFKLDEVIEITDNKNKTTVKVIGFLEDSSYGISGTLPSEITILDKFLLIPNKPLENYNGDLFGRVYSSVIDVHDGINISEEIKGIMEKAKAFNMDITINTVESMVDNKTYIYKDAEKVTKVLFLTIFIFASVGFITSMLYSINKRIKEFGVHLMMGATLKDIALRIFYEISIIMILSYMGSITIISFTSEGLLNKRALIQSAFSAIVFTVLLGIIPIIKVKTLKINELIKGNE